jgi:Na+/melibiose symporter-like transporter
MIGIMMAFGFFLGLSSIALPSMLADIVDYDVWRNRQDRAAIFFSFQSVVTKLNQGIGGAVALAIPALFGFTGGHGADTARADARPEGGLHRLAMPAARADAHAGLAFPPLGRRAHGILSRRLGGPSKAMNCTHGP